MSTPPKSQYVNEDNFVTSIFLFTFKTLFLTSLETNFGRVKQAIEQCWVSSASPCSLWEAPTGIFAIHSTPEWFLSVHWCDFHLFNKFRSKNPCTMSRMFNPSPPPTPTSLPVLVTVRPDVGWWWVSGTLPMRKEQVWGRARPSRQEKRKQPGWGTYRWWTLV